MVGYDFPVEASQILLFARAIGDENPVYTERTSAAAAGFDGVLAPPTFAVASVHFDPDYELRPRQGRPWIGSARESSGAPLGETGWLHAEQHFEFRRPMVSGEILEVIEREGRSWEKASRGGGTLRFEERCCDYRVSGTGEVVTVVRAVYVLPTPTAEEI